LLVVGADGHHQHAAISCANRFAICGSPAAENSVRVKPTLAATYIANARRFRDPAEACYGYQVFDRSGFASTGALAQGRPGRLALCFRSEHSFLLEPPSILEPKAWQGVGSGPALAPQVSAACNAGSMIPATAIAT